VLIEQNAKQALQSLVLEQGQTHVENTASQILADPQITQLFLGGGLAPVGGES
jgi:ABC-type branched-subunit amino acid transport system ATPase component